MAIRREKRWTQTMAQIRKNVEALTARGCILIQQELRAELSKPGTGRFYARHKATRALSGSVHGELSLPQVESLIARERVRSGRRGAPPRSLRAIGVHRASAPGHPPAVDTGRYRASMQVDLSRLKQMNPIGRVGTNMAQGRGLEYGTRKMAMRPHFRPVMRRMRPAILNLYRTGGFVQARLFTK